MKPWWKSRTVWVNAGVAFLPLFPAVKSWIFDNPIHFAQMHALMNLVLRFDTKHALGPDLKEES